MSLPTSTIGLILFVRPASMSVMALSPKFIPPLRRAHPALGILGGSICILVSMLAFMALESDAPIYVLVAVLVVQGLGLGLANPMLMTVITLRVPTDSIGTVSAIVTMLMTISSSVGMVMMLAIVASLGGVFELSAYWCVPNRHAIISIGACHHAEAVHDIVSPAATRAMASSQPVPDPSLRGYVRSPAPTRSSCSLAHSLGELAHPRRHAGAFAHDGCLRCAFLVGAVASTAAIVACAAMWGLMLREARLSYNEFGGDVDLEAKAKVPHSADANLGTPASSCSDLESQGDCRTQLEPEAPLVALPVPVAKGAAGTDFETRAG
jgi:hypothetical protein